MSEPHVVLECKVCHDAYAASTGEIQPDGVCATCWIEYGEDWVTPMPDDDCQMCDGVGLEHDAGCPTESLMRPCW